MLKASARLIGALALGAVLALPFATANAQSPAPPTTAPTKDAGKTPAAPQTTPDAPKASSPPAPPKGSTTVPGWNNPPSWTGASERPQYASIPGTERNRLIQGEGREWRVFRNGPLTQYGGWILVLVLAAIVVFYLIKG